MKIQSVAILGAGAVGCYVLWGLADKAAANSLQLGVVAEGSRAERLRQNGCTINGQVYHPQVWTQQQAHGRRDPCRQRPLLCPLNGRQKQAPYAGRQHNARRHAAEHPPGGRLPGLPQQEHTSRTGCGAEHRQQQHCRRQENLFQIALPLFPVYARAAGGVQRATLNRIFKRISAKFP